MNNLQCI